MEIIDPKIQILRRNVDVAREELNMAVMFHEVWKQTIEDSNLHERLGVSYATQAFLVIQFALRREMLLALMRIWDNTQHGKHGTSLRIQYIVKKAYKDKDKAFFDVLVHQRAKRFPEAFEIIREEIKKQLDEAVSLIDKYEKSAEYKTVFSKLINLRNERLAHRNLPELLQEPSLSAGRKKEVPQREEEVTPKEIEEFYQDTMKIVRILLHAVNADASDPEDHAKVFRVYAVNFWKRVQREEEKSPPSVRSEAQN